MIVDIRVLSELLGLIPFACSCLYTVRPLVLTFNTDHQDENRVGRLSELQEAF